LLRTLYYETEPVLTGGFSEVNRSQRIEMAQAEFRAAMGNGRIFRSWTATSFGTIRRTG
jgi:UTP:GlnB (protein PII) uridylyltransferase